MCPYDCATRSKANHLAINSSQTIRLRAFGGLSIDPEGRLPGVATQRRRLALLAVLVTAGDRGISRDRLLALLWPESDTDSARHSLNQMVYVLRRALGREDAIVGPLELRLSAGVLGSDYDDFVRALRSGDLEGAADLYTGPFLDGFHLHAAPEFERWVDEVRMRTAREAADAITALAERADAAREHAAAVRWWRRLAALDPLDSRVAQSLVTSLTKAGDAAGALAHARAHETLLQEEFGTEPDGVLARHILRVRPETDLPAQVEQSPSEAPASPTLPPRPTASGWRRSVVRPLSLFAALLVGWIAAGQDLRSTEAIDANRWLVLPFAVSGDAGAAYLQSGLVDMLAMGLEGAGPLHAVDPRAVHAYVASASGPLDPAAARQIAAHFGAGSFVLGSVFESSGKLRISATLYQSGRAQPAGVAAAEGAASDIFSVIDDLSGRLLALGAKARGEQFSRIAAVTTHSLPALKSFLTGESDFRAGRYDAALGAYRQAVAADSGFALAYYRMSVAADWNSAPDDLPRKAADQATRFASRLSEHDRLLLDGLRAWRAGEWDRAEQTYRSVLARHPDDVEGWYQLGEILFHGNPIRGRPLNEARVPFERVLFYEPANREAMLHSIRIAAAGGRLEEVDALMARALPLSPGGDDLALRAFRAALGRDTTALARALAQLEGTDYSGVFTLAWRIAAYTDNPSAAERALGLLTVPSRSTQERAFGHVLLAHIAFGRGQWRAGRARLDSASVYLPAWALELRAFFAGLPFSPLSRNELLAIRDSLRGWDPRSAPAPGPTPPIGYHGPHDVLRVYLLGELAVRLGDQRAADDAERSLDRWAGIDSAPASRLGASLRSYGRITFAPGTAHIAGEPGLAPDWPGARHFHRFIHGLTLTGVRDQEALKAFASFEHIDIESLPFAAAGHLERARIYSRLGQADSARLELRRAQAIWSDCDPELRALLTLVPPGRATAAR